MSSGSGPRQLRWTLEYRKKIEIFQSIWEASSTWKIQHEPSMIAVQLEALESVLKDSGFIYIGELKAEETLLDYFENMDESRLEVVADAINRGYVDNDWDSFLNLDIITMIPSPPRESDVGVVNQHEVSTAAWNSPYYGNSSSLLESHIHHFYQSSDGIRLYGHMCAIIQSSGMGKSRLVDEYAKTHLVIPVNLRRAETGFPPPDTEARDYLAAEIDVKSVIKGRCIGFLIGLFQRTLQVIDEESKRSPGSTKEELADWFRRRMSPDVRTGHRSEFRVSFFSAVLEIASDNEGRFTKADTDHLDTMKRDDEKGGAAGSSTRDNRKAEQVSNQYDKGSKTTTKPDTEAGGYATEEANKGKPAVGNTTTKTGTATVSKLYEAAKRLTTFLRNLGTKAKLRNSARVQVVLAFDEANALSENIYQTNKQGPWSNFTALRDALRNVHTFPVWSLFISTTGNVSQFNPHPAIDPSMRIRTEQYAAVPPFTTLRYDAFAPRVVIDSKGKMTHYILADDGSKPMRTIESDLMLQDVTKLQFMVRFGRPLFAVWWEYGKDVVKNKMIRFAMDKLICGAYDSEMEDREKLNVTFACLSQRLCLEFNSTSYNIDEENQIAAHMRLCLKIGADNQFTVSSSGSEPLLAEAASTIMMRESFKPAEALKSILAEFPISKGDRGELVAMLATTIARDMAVEARLSKLGIFKSVYSGQIGPEVDSYLFRAVRVCEFLGKLFRLEEPILKLLEADFGNAYIHFNHFIKPFTQDTCTLQFLLQYMTRGAAVLCANCMPGIDFLFAALFKSKGGLKLRRDRLTAIYVQVKDVVGLTFEGNAEDIFSDMPKGISKSIGSDGCEFPIIRIIFSLLSNDGLKYQHRTITLPNGTSVQTHDFWCGGFGPHFLYGDHGRETQDTWRALANATMKMKELFGDKKESSGIGKERKFLAPGGSKNGAFWSWISKSGTMRPDTADDELDTDYTEDDLTDEDVEMEDAESSASA